MTFLFSDSSANTSMGFGNTAKPTFGTNTFGFGSGAATTSAGGFGGGFGSAPATSNTTFGFGTTPVSSTGNTGFGGFGAAPISTSSMFSGFGAPAATSTAFSGFGTNTGTTGSAFGTAAATPFGTAGSAFGATNTFGAATSGFGSTAPTFGSTAPAFGSTAPTFGQTATSFGSSFGTAGTTGFGTQGFGTGFGNKPLGATGTGFSGFGTNLGGAFGQQQQQIQQPQVAANPNEALVNAVFNCNIFGDERDQILAKWNFLQAKWGFGKAYFATNQPPIELTEQNPLCRFKAIGYTKIPTGDDKEGLVKLVFNKLEQEVKTQQAQLQTSLTALLGNKPNLTITIDSIKAISETKTEVIIYVTEKSATGGSGSKIPGSELVQFFNGAMQRQQLTNLGASGVMPHSKPDLKQKKEYLETPPPGIDVRLWKQAQADNPDPTKYIPMPIIGFSEVKWRMRCHEEQTRVHVAFLTQAAEEITELKGRHAATDAALHDQRRRYMHLHHRLLAVVVRQESARRAGAAMTPEEEALRARLEALHAQLSAPTQFNGRLSELLSQMRMQRCQAASQSSERYSMDQGSQDDIRQFLTMQQKGMTHLIETVHRDMAHLKLIQEGMMRIVHGAE